MTDVTPLTPRRHEAPDGWPREVFERVVDTLALALVEAYRRDHERKGEGKSA